MTDKDNPYQGAINDLIAKIEDRMKPILEDKRMVNKLCELAGLAPRYADAELMNTGSLAIKRDQFHAKPLATAVREYLAQRGPSDRGGLGAASVNEIFDALIAGGYKPETDDELNAKRGLRIALTKNSYVFYRVPGGAYGLLEWYPNAKPQDDSDRPTGKARRGRPPKAKQKKRGRPPKAKAAENVMDLARDTESEAATGKKPAAASELRNPRATPDEGKRGTDQPPRGKEKPHVDHEPDVGHPVTGPRAA